MEDVWQNDFKRRSIKTAFHKEETIRKIAKMPEVLIIKYKRYRNNEQLNHHIKCNISIKFNQISYKLKAVIINNDHIIEDHQDKSYQKNLISQAYILLFEKDTPL